jgi:hypothetical protein
MQNNLAVCYVVFKKLSQNLSALIGQLFLPSYLQGKWILYSSFQGATYPAQVMHSSSKKQRKKEDILL